MTNTQTLQESMNELANQFSASGWVALDGWNDDQGLSLDALHTVSEQLQDMTETNPLLVRGAQLRYGYVFGRGVIFEGTTKARTKVDDPYNQQVLFTQKAWEELNKARFATGNVLIQRDKRTQQLTRIPMSQVTNVITDPESAERIWAIERSWSANGKSFSRWMPLNTYKGSQKSFTDPISGTRATLDPNYVVYHDAVNKQVGWTWGVPDALAASLWAMAYSEYLKNNSKLVRAYARYAFKVTAGTSGGQQQAAAQIRRPANVGGTAVQGPGSELTPVPPTGSSVDFSKGTALASMAASSLGVSVIALLSDPSSAAGSYGSAQTLDAPTIRGMTAIQDSWINFFTTIVQDMGAKSAEVRFPNIETDTPHRQSQILTSGVGFGLLHREEARRKYLDLADIDDIVKGMPELDEFTESNMAPHQGNSGVAGAVTGTKTRDDE